MEIILFDNAGKENQPKYFNKFEDSFQTPNTQWTYCKDTYNLRQLEEETVEQHETRLMSSLSTAMQENNYTTEKAKYFSTLQTIFRSSMTSENIPCYSHIRLF